MLEIILSNRFKKDMKLLAKRKCDMALLDGVVTQLAQQKKLPQKYRDHDLSGDHAGFRECHIQPDWLLIYRVQADALLLFLTRTGTHADLLER